MNPRRRSHGFVPLARLPLPEGSPGTLYQAQRRARVRLALGAQLGPHVVDVVFDIPRVVLVLEGDGWERALAPVMDDVARRVASALGREAVVLEVRSRPAPAGEQGTADSSPHGRPVDGSDDLARLRRAAERILARRDS